MKYDLGCWWHQSFHPGGRTGRSAEWAWARLRRKHQRGRRNHGKTPTALLGPFHLDVARRCLQKVIPSCRAEDRNVGEEDGGQADQNRSKDRGICCVRQPSLFSTPFMNKRWPSLHVYVLLIVCTCGNTPLAKQKGPRCSLHVTLLSQRGAWGVWVCVCVLRQNDLSLPKSVLTRAFMLP